MRLTLGTWIDVLRTGSWVTRDRVRALCVCYLAMMAVSVAYLASGPGLFDPLGRPLGHDFVVFWSASRGARAGSAPALYSPAAFYQLATGVLGVRTANLSPFIYPPTALLLFYPLSFLPYLASLAAWLSFGAAGYLSAVMRIAGASRWTWLLAVSFPAAWVNAINGHNGFISAALLGWALVLLPRSGWLAGSLMGLLSFKPQLGLLIPVALIAGREWRAFMAASLVTAAMVAASVAAFGLDTWRAFAGATPLIRSILDLGLLDYYKLQSPFAAVRLIGGGVSLAWATQGVIGALSAIVVAAVWRTSREQAARAVVLVCATLLATPYVLDYDLTLLAVALAFAVRRARTASWSPWELTLLVVVGAVPALARPLGMVSHVGLAPLAIGLLLGHTAWRELRRPRTCTPAVLA